MEGLHRKLNLKLVCNRRKLFMLKMVYTLSQDAEDMNNYRPEITLRTGEKLKVKVDLLISNVYTGAPIMYVLHCGTS